MSVHNIWWIICNLILPCWLKTTKTTSGKRHAFGLQAFRNLYLTLFRVQAGVAGATSEWFILTKSDHQNNRNSHNFSLLLPVYMYLSTEKFSRNEGCMNSAHISPFGYASSWSRSRPVTTALKYWQYEKKTQNKRWLQSGLIVIHRLKYDILLILHSSVSRPRSESESERQQARNGASESEGEFFPKRARIITSES